MCAQLEELKLFSTAERLGLLSTLERLLNSDPAAVSSLALVPFVGTIGEPANAITCNLRCLASHMVLSTPHGWLSAMSCLSFCQQPTVVLRGCMNI